MQTLKRSRAVAETGPTVVLDEPGQPTRYVWQLEKDGVRWEYDRQRGQARRVPEAGESSEWEDLAASSWVVPHLARK
jgi:hypothetical protein